MFALWMARSTAPRLLGSPCQQQRSCVGWSVGTARPLFSRPSAIPPRSRLAVQDHRVASISNAPTRSLVAAGLFASGLRARRHYLSHSRRIQNPGVPATATRSSVSSAPAEPMFDEVRGWICNARSITVLSGAGISTDSGVPDFRGPSGVWTRDPSMQRLVDLDAWLTDEKVRIKGWDWLKSWNLDALQPNPGHEAIVELYRQGKLELCVTQNTEGLQERAGLPDSKLVTIHGSRRHVNCMRRSMQSWLDFSRPPVAATGGGCEFWCFSGDVLRRVEEGEADPPCPKCGGILKTANISFGQSLVPGDIARADAAAQACEILLAVGSTLAVYPVAGMVPLAKQAGAKVVIVNGEATAMDHLADAVLRGSLSEVLPWLVGNVIADGSSNL